MKSLARAVLVIAASISCTPTSLAEDITWRSDLALCAGCHGTHGEGATNGIPRLAGQNPQYMSHALSMFKAGTRASPVMQPIAKGLDDADIPALAAYFATQRAPRNSAKASASSQMLQAGKQLVEAGPTPCFSCHGAGGRGNGARYPSIVGQPAQFVVDRLHEFQGRARDKAPQPGTMTAVAATMTEDQIAASAAYLAHLQR